MQDTDMSNSDQITFRTDDEFVDASVGAAVKLSDVLKPEEIKPFVARSDLRAWWMMAVNFAIIVGAFALPIIWLNPITVILAILLLGGRQMGLAVVYHDCSHGVFFRTRWLNDFVGHWIAAALLNTSMYAYRSYHLKHHRFAGTKEDPDMPLALTYPTSRESLKRKFIRDLTGRTGWKDVSRQFQRLGLRRNAPFLIAHALLLGSLWVAGAAWAYLLWWVAQVVVFQAVLRLRFISEHGVAIDRLAADARENTSTTLLAPWERLFIGANYVNYHLEHHLSAAVPCYRLAALHKFLSARGFFENHACLSSGYADVLRKAVKPQEPIAQAA